jgi:zinc transport system ATP-binding protein
MKSQPLLSAHQISHKFDQDWVLENIDFKLNPGQIITLIGPNGAGKSTLLRILLGLIKPTQGIIHKRSDINIGFMPQKVQLDATLPMNVAQFLKLAIKPKHPAWQIWKGSSAPSFNPEQDAIIKELNIFHLLEHPIQKISGGELQRVLLARALMNNPNLLVLDEPVQGVDIQGQNELYEYIQSIRQQHQCGILMVSHDLHIVMKHTDEVLCLNRHLCCSGHPIDIQASKEYQTLFGQDEPAVAVYEHHHNSQECDHAHGDGHIHTHHCEKH